jgi:hypothetical protein
MNTFALEIWNDEASKCTFYTVRTEDSIENETDKFFNKYDAIPEFKQSTQILLGYIQKSIGEDHGANDLLLAFLIKVKLLLVKSYLCSQAFH